MSTATDPLDLLRLARGSAVAAGDLLRRGQSTASASASVKTTAGDVVCALDRASEALIVERLLAARPHDSILGEESGERRGRSGVRWIVDPLDGTLNYLRGLAGFAVSVAAEVDGEVVAGAVHDPTRAHTYSAARGHGAFLDGRRLRASGQQRLDRALVGTGFGSNPVARARQAALMGVLAGMVVDIRHSGSAALDLCHVAAGRLDLYCEHDLRYWDRAAGTLIAAEAGAEVGGAAPGPPGDDFVVAGSPPLVEQLRRIMTALA